VGGDFLVSTFLIHQSQQQLSVLSRPMATLHGVTGKVRSARTVLRQVDRLSTSNSACPALPCHALKLALQIKPLVHSRLESLDSRIMHGNLHGGFNRPALSKIESRNRLAEATARTVPAPAVQQQHAKKGLRDHRCSTLRPDGSIFQPCHRPSALPCSIIF